MAIHPDSKKMLMERGKWPDFIAYRESLISTGQRGCDADYESVLKFLGESAPGLLRRRSRGKVRIQPPLKVEKLASLGGDRLNVGAALVGCSLTMAEISGKTATSADCIRWVARYMDVADVEATDAPDPTAWGLLRMCRESPAFKVEFYKSMYTKTIDKGEAGSSLDAPVDGQPTMDLIGQILKAKEQSLRGSSEVERRVHNPEVAGSNPVPATNSAEKAA